MDIAEASIHQLLSELRGRPDVIAVKCWTTSDLKNWLTLEIDTSSDDKERQKFLVKYFDDIISMASGLSQLEDATNDDWDLIESAMMRSIRHWQQKVEEEANDATRTEA